jgi:L-alanine-DL-glutamate epimerase-like enolase superfamily enzyme
MRIADVEAAWLSLPLPVPRGLSGGPIRASTDAVCRISTADGLTGIGESRGGPLEDICRIIVEVFRSLLLDESPFETAHLWQKMMSALLDGAGERQSPWARRTVLAAAAAVDLALWDIKARVAGVSVCELLGGRRRAMPAYLSEGFYIEGQTLDEMVQEAAAAVEAGGYRALKIRIGRGTADESESRVRAIRDGLGEGITLMADANQAWSVETALETCRRLEPYGLFWLEEPVPVRRTEGYDPDDACGQIARATPIPLASGENHIDLAECHSLVEKGGVRYMQFDAVKNGGATEFLRVAALCQAHGVPMAPHHVPHFHVQLAAAVPNGLIVETFDNAKQHVAWPDLFPGYPEVRNGHVTVPDGPGWGMDVNDDLIERLGVKVRWRPRP